MSFVFLFMLKTCFLLCLFRRLLMMVKEEMRNTNQVPGQVALLMALHLRLGHEIFIVYFLVGTKLTHGIIHLIQKILSARPGIQILFTSVSFVSPHLKSSAAWTDTWFALTFHLLLFCLSFYLYLLCIYISSHHHFSS